MVILERRVALQDLFKALAGAVVCSQCVPCRGVIHDATIAQVAHPPPADIALERQRRHGTRRGVKLPARMEGVVRTL